MKTETKSVVEKKSGKTLGTATYSVFDSVEDITLNLDAEQIVALVNRQSKGQAINKVRAIASADIAPRQIGRVAAQLRKGTLDKASAAEALRQILASA